MKRGVAEQLATSVHDGLYPAAGKLWCACGEGPFTGPEDPAWRAHFASFAETVPLTETEADLLDYIDDLERAAGVPS